MAVVLSCEFYIATILLCTPADIQELLMSRSVLALVNGEPWDIHRPLVENCELRFLHFKDEDPSLSNEVLARSNFFVVRCVC